MYFLKTLLVIVILYSVITCYAYGPEDYIFVLGATTWGFWGITEACPNGSYAYGFETRIEPDVGVLDDNTALNAIRLFCRTPDGNHTGDVTSSVMDRGLWTGAVHCPTGYLAEFTIKSQAEHAGDETAANGLRMWCLGSSQTLESPGTTEWGIWLGNAKCPPNRAICGLMTLVEDDQGAIGDDTALNDVRFLCCDLPA